MAFPGEICERISRSVEYGFVAVRIGGGRDYLFRLRRDFVPPESLNHGAPLDFKLMLAGYVAERASAAYSERIAAARTAVLGGRYKLPHFGGKIILAAAVYFGIADISVRRAGNENYGAAFVARDPRTVYIHIRDVVALHSFPPGKRAE